MGPILASNVDPSAKVQLVANWDLAPVVAGLVGAGCETIFRNRGIPVPVAPMMVLRRGIWAWLGYREEWDSERPAKTVKRYSFRSAAITVHFGFRNNITKPQMFRAEWAGWARWNRQSYGYQAGNAAHPHWQFDALDSLFKDDAAERANAFLELLEHEAMEEPKEFSPQLDDDDLLNLVGSQRLSRIHFASAAAWWRGLPQDAHAHAPSTVGEVQDWVRKCLSYVTVELHRLH